MPKKLGRNKPDEVDATSVQYDEMELNWDLPDTLWGGTTAMRLKPEFLPKFKGEKQLEFQERLNQSFLFNQYKNTIEDVVAKPFSESVIVTEPPVELEGFEDDVDGKGTNLTQFGKDVYEAGMRWGLSHILVDAPPIPKMVDDVGNEVARTLADQMRDGRRPVWVHVTPKTLLGWRTETIAGQTILTQIRVKEYAVEPVLKKTYLDQTVEYVRVINRTTWELWKKNPKGKWDLDDNGTNDLGWIPLKTFYVRPTGYLTADPTFMDLAWLNLEHWQSKSDQRNILHYSRFAQLFAKGMTIKEIKASQQVGANRLMAAKDTDADMKYVEIAGPGIAAGERDLKHIEDQMEVVKATPFVQRKGFDTKATGMIINEARSTSPVKAWANIESTVLKGAYELTAEWLNLDLPEKFEVKVYTDFVNAAGNSKDMDHVIELRQEGTITKKTELQEAQRRGIVVETIDPDDELEAAAGESMDELKAAVKASKDPDPDPDEGNED